MAELEDITNNEIDLAVPTTNSGSLADTPKRTRLNTLLKKVKSNLSTLAANAVPSLSGLSDVDDAAKADQSTLNWDEVSQTYVSKPPIKFRLEEGVLYITDDGTEP